MRHIMATAATIGVLAFSPLTVGADVNEDVLRATTILTEIMDRREAAKRSYDRALEAISKTEEGKNQMKKCKSVGINDMTLCIVKNWPTSDAHEQLTEEFYSEELRRLRSE